MMTLSIQNFKCFNNIQLHLNRLTLFTGANGYGKSTIIQSLLYMRRTLEHSSVCNSNQLLTDVLIGQKVELNGSYALSLGMSSDIIPVNAEHNSQMILRLCDGDSYIRFVYELNDEKKQMWLKILESDFYQYAELPLVLPEFYYLNAERLGPRTSQAYVYHDFPNVGYHGESTAQILAQYGYKNSSDIEIEVDINRRIDSGSKYLISQVSQWMDFLMPGLEIDVRYDEDLQRAQVLVKNTFSQDKSVVATNIGFGISYSLPIIVTGLLAKKGSIMIVENPEAHLHPSAQSRIGVFLARVAQSGVNLIVETHSDHVLNGIQIAVAKEFIDNQLITVNYFSCENGAQPDVKELTLSQQGYLSEWPKGFFDQTQEDYSVLFHLRRND